MVVVESSTFLVSQVSVRDTCVERKSKGSPMYWIKVENIGSVDCSTVVTVG